MSNESPSLDVSADAGAPTLARYGVLAFLCTLALLLYVDRVCIGQAEQSIRDDLGLSKKQMSWVFSAFTLAYCLFEVPTGHWGDRYGSRGVIARIVVWWSAFTALTGASMGLWSLLAVRFLFGAGEAGAFPNTARVVTRWFPVEDRGKVRGAITTVSLLGGAFAPIMAAVLIERIGWRWTFVAFGSVGVVWAAMFYLWFRDDPAEHPAVNAAELQFINPTVAEFARIRAESETPRNLANSATSVETNESDPSAEHAGIPWGIVLTSPNMWLLGGIMTVSAILFYTQFQWFPTYLKEVRGLTEEQSGWMTTLLMLGGAAGCITGGFLADAAVRRTRERKWTRRLTGGGALLFAALSVLAVRYSDSAGMITFCNASALFFVQVAVPTWWTVVAEISGRHGAALWGLMNSMAGLGLMVSTVLIGWFVEMREQQGLPLAECWSPVFDGVAVGLAVGAVFWLLVDATRSIVERPQMVES